MGATGETVEVIGGQFGDEGKGKVTDLFANEDNVAIVARGNGGANAGHNIHDPDSGVIFATHQLPSGIFNDECLNIIGQGTVVDPIALVAEMKELGTRNRYLTPQKLLISSRAQVIFPTHRMIDAAKDAVGTTGRGIGPAYRDKAARLGLRMIDLYTNPDAAKELLHNHKIELSLLGRSDLADDSSWIDTFFESVDKVKCYVADPIPFIHRALRNGKKIIAEGAQGVLLDVNVGTYPYVTSSSTTATGVIGGIDGLPPSSVKEVFGIFKLPMTRVGMGPFVTELTDEEADLAIHLGGVQGELGAEYGATTGRKRDIGWFDAFSGAYSVKAGGITAAVLTKLDMLDGIDTLKICTGYKIDGKVVDIMPANAEQLFKARPIYEEYKGWKQKTEGIHNFKDLPPEAAWYVLRIQELLEIPVKYIGTGTARHDLIKR